MTRDPKAVAECISEQLARSATRDPADRRSDFNDMLKGFTVPELSDFLASEGIRFTGKPKRAEVVAELLDIYTPTTTQESAVTTPITTEVVAHRATKAAAERYIASFADVLGDTVRWDGHRDIPVHIEWTAVRVAKGYDIVSTVTAR